MSWVVTAAAAAVLNQAPANHAAADEPAREPAVLTVVSCRPESVVAARRSLAEDGATVIAHLAPHRWLVAGDSAVDGAASGIDSSRPWRSTEGVGAALRALAAPTKKSGDPTVFVAVALAPGTEVSQVGERLETVGAQLVWMDESAQPAPQIGFSVPRSRIREIVDLLDRTPVLVWADPQAPVRLLNSDSVWRGQSGLPRETPIFGHGLFGEGQVIGIMDTGIDIDECRFDDPKAGMPALNRTLGTSVNPDHRKVLAVDFHWDDDWPPGLRSWDDQGHGTHVAGSAAGDVEGNGTHDGVDGMAPAARLVIQDGGARADDCADLPGLGCPVKPLEPVLEQAWSQGARIHTNSWGDEENFLPYGRYTERTADVDRFMWRHKDTLVFFAAGNSGPNDDTVISPATGKNVVAVGATLHGDFQPPCAAPFSSRGWARDGRIKPDLVAPGMWVVSAATNGLVPDPSCNNTTKSGTSMAAPTAAGFGALVRQYFADGFYPTGGADPSDAFEPSAALVKAVLIASAVDLSAMGCADEPIPSRDQGWGLIQLDRALAFPGDDHRLFVDDHRNGFSSIGDAPVTVELTVVGPGPLKVVLVWTDAPSSSLAEFNLVNDLDLTVSGRGGLYRGNTFVRGVSVPGGEPDRLNNVEVVYLPEAESGVWSIEIKPHAIPAPEQDFALVVTSALRLSPRPRRPSGRAEPDGSNATVGPTPPAHPSNRTRSRPSAGSADLPDR